MFEDVPTEDLPTVIAAVEHDFEEDMGASRVDAITGWDRVIRHAQAEQLKEINGLYEDRNRVIGAFREGDPALHVIGQVSLARNISPGAAGSQFGLALQLADLPQVAEALKAGLISEPTVRAICRPVSGLSTEDKALFDAEIAPKLPGLTPRRAGQLAERIVISLDADAAAERAERRREDVRVNLTAHPDGVATLTVEGPAEQLTAAHAALESWALGLRSAGDERSLEQIMCTTLFERVTGASHATDTTVEVGIVIDVATLMGAAGNPVELVGHGPIAPAVADELIGNAHRVFYRRLITDPITQTLIARDERRRYFDGALAGFIRTRDRHRCRQPGCDCRIRDVDHITAYTDGGITRDDNGQGLCRRSHVIKHLPGWNVTAQTDGTISWRTPAGHTYRSRAPSLHPLAA
ncbi:MAG TPA: DUF222 domain-containing protein [Aeromicrobium sp.]|nr:DUF222 domain-containing protein [Aeromicrobium sp.]